MRLHAAIFALLASCTSPAAVDSALAGPPGERTPVIVELFSSEGCSSCPPADAVLRALGATQPVPGALVIPLELHVDYWNYLGWADPFSRPEYTARQRAYSSAFRQRGVYTPQMVIDGKAELVGSRDGAAKRLIAEAARAPKAKVHVERKGSSVAVSIRDVPPGQEGLTVWLAIAEENLEVPVSRGENAGQKLAHGPVVRSLKSLGTMTKDSKSQMFSSTLALDPAWRQKHLRAVAFVQRSASLQIAGAGALSLAE
jgi:hypothetical protein